MEMSYKHNVCPILTPDSLNWSLILELVRSHVPGLICIASTET